MSIASKIRELRKSRQMKQEDLAKILDVSVSSISLWESGDTVPRMAQLIRMAEYFGITVSELVDSDYYVDDDAKLIAQELKTRPELQILFDAVRDVSREDLLMIASLVTKFRK